MGDEEFPSLVGKAAPINARPLDSSGQYYYGVPGMSFYGATTDGIQTGSDFYWPMLVTAPIILRGTALEVTTTPATDSNVRLAVYLADSSFQPTQLIYGSGEIGVPNGFTGPIRQFGMEVLLPPKLYLLAMCNSVLTYYRAYTGVTLTGASSIPYAMGAGLVQHWLSTRTYDAFPNPAALSGFTSAGGAGTGWQVFPLLAWDFA